MIGIDFGYAFGSATQFLPVPELVPFRLTRCIKGFDRRKRACVCKVVAEREKTGKKKTIRTSDKDK